MSFKVVFFSGTGGTRLVARALYDGFQSRGAVVELAELHRKAPVGVEDCDVLALCFPVYAGRPPAPVMSWLAGLPVVDGKRAVVVSVSGGGEMTPNRACRVAAIARLRRRGFRVVYETMLVMPSNFFSATPSPLIHRLFEVLPARAVRVVDDVLRGVQRRVRPDLLSRFLAVVGLLENIASRVVGRLIKARASCDGCGWCARRCPTANIRLVDGSPRFGWSCALCTRCLYGCPRNALFTPFDRFILLENGFDLARLRTVPRDTAMEDGRAGGAAWAGVRRYLEEDVTVNDVPKTTPPA